MLCIDFFAALAPASRTLFLVSVNFYSRPLREDRYLWFPRSAPWSGQSHVWETHTRTHKRIRGSKLPRAMSRAHAVTWIIYALSISSQDLRFRSTSFSRYIQYTYIFFQALSRPFTMPLILNPLRLFLSFVQCRVRAVPHSFSISQQPHVSLHFLKKQTFETFFNSTNVVSTNRIIQIRKLQMCLVIRGGKKSYHLNDKHTN